MFRERSRSTFSPIGLQGGSAPYIHRGRCIWRIPGTVTISSFSARFSSGPPCKTAFGFDVTSEAEDHHFTIPHGAAMEYFHALVRFRHDARRVRHRAPVCSFAATTHLADGATLVSSQSTSSANQSGRLLRRLQSLPAFPKSFAHRCSITPASATRRSIFPDGFTHAPSGSGGGMWLET